MSKIIRKKKKTNFSIVSKTHLQDNTLSWGATGLLTYLLSLPDDWNIYVSDLKNRKINGRDSTRTLLNELIKKDYIIRKPQREKNGTFKGYNYYVFEQKTYSLPHPDNPTSVNPTSVDPTSDNPTLYNNNISNTNLNEYSNYKMEFWSKNLKKNFEKYIQYMKSKKGKSWYNEITVNEIKSFLNQVRKNYDDEKICAKISECIRNGYTKLVFDEQIATNNIYDDFL